jgi:hypothetical protein
MIEVDLYKYMPSIIQNTHFKYILDFFEETEFKKSDIKKRQLFALNEK